MWCNQVDCLNVSAITIAHVWKAHILSHANVYTTSFKLTKGPGNSVPLPVSNSGGVLPELFWESIQSQRLIQPNATGRGKLIRKVLMPQPRADKAENKIIPFRDIHSSVKQR